MNQNYQEDPIHKIGYIQPHGILLVLQEPELIIIQVSENLDSHLGIISEDLLGKELATIFNENQLNTINNYLQDKILNLLVAWSLF